MEGVPLSKIIQNSELLILKEIAELLNESTEVEKMLPEVLNKLLNVTGLEIGWMFLVDGDGGYRLVAKESLPPALSLNDCSPMCSGECWCINRYNIGRLHKATNIIECKRIEDALAIKSGATNGLTHHATVPLRAGDEKFGILNVGSPNKTTFEPSELALLESVAFQIGTALKRIRLSQKEQETALIAERNRLARDLHDSVNQLLFSLSLTARGGMEMTDDEGIKETFSYLQDLAQEALGEMRALIWQLRPIGLEHGIVSSLKAYGQMLNLNMRTKISGVAGLPGKVEEALWRIGQEALANCKKHSQSADVDLSLMVANHKVEMEITDRGCGFVYMEQNEIPSLGLKSMKTRAESLNGTFHLTSAPGKGTQIKIKIPI
ncbi:histidine kinase [Heyndrickxia shackletonii]|uniref:histidine kinase n=1 Tax=Heyndrickxia shackletonii TaxID=157838 RepID=A0A0Q3WSC2_9BACI|nr:GAF domain-containing sensor histidine kinase [Heyndrickxia shackletonii]KQL50853.1 histidine kinase [Heyndrickxia shackletonii]NEZ01736.1 GAF domain-containing sensor histidine kinase [Heyndrickxia shackletonii]